MRGERGQATVEWIGLLLLVALALAALSRLAPPADGQDLGTKLAHSVTGAAARKASSTPTRSAGGPRASLPRPLPAGGPALGARLPELPSSLRRAKHGAGTLWKRAWFACLVYERTRYALAHPESRFPGYTLPFDDAFRMVNNCVSPVDVFENLQLPDADR